MARQLDNSHFQPLSLYTRSPVRMDYNRILPPLADQPLLELRRPANKDACFAISALSPTMSKRFGGDWDSMSGRTSLLDRYLGQQALSPMASDYAKNPIEAASQLPATPILSNVAANSKALWALISHRQAQTLTERPPSQGRVQTLQRIQTPPDTRPQDRSQTLQRIQTPPDRMPDPSPRESSAQRRRRERGPPPIDVKPSVPPKPAWPSPELDKLFIPRLEGFPIPRESPVLHTTPVIRAPRVPRAGPPVPRAAPLYGPGPPSNGSSWSNSTGSMASALAELGTVPTSSRVDSWIGPPLSPVQTMPNRGRNAPRYPGLPPAPNAKLKSYVPKIKTVRFAGSRSNEGSLKSPTVYSYTSYSNDDRSWPSPSPTSFSPVTPVAMNFTYPLILEETPELDQVPWDEETEMLHDSPHESVMTIVSGKAVLHSPNRASKFDDDDDPGLSHRPRSRGRTRTRSHSPPKSALPSDSPHPRLPPTIHAPGQATKAPDRHRPRPGAKDDFDVKFAAGHDLTRNVADLDRTALWVLCGTTRATVERTQTVPTGTIGNDREAILSSYFHR